MKIRTATENDVLKVSRLWLQMVNELAPELTPNVNWWRVHATGFLKQKNYKMLVAEKGGKLCGFIDYFLFPEPATGKIHAIGQHFFVIPEHRKGKLSGDIWKMALNASKLQGAIIHELCCFEKELPFWKKHGFLPKRILVRKERMR